MKPTESIYILLSLFLIFSCEDKNSVEPLVCGEGTTEVNGECVIDCGEGLVVSNGECVCPYGYTYVDNVCYYESDLLVLKKLFELSDSTSCTGYSDVLNLCSETNTVYSCDFDTSQRVTSLLIMNFNLVGEIPSEIGSLTKLTYLYLGDNQLTGSIPSEIGNLTNLTLLNLVGNQLTGSIPSEIGNMINLKTLGLGRNQLTGSIPSEIGSLVNLKNLVLQSNQLTGIVPSSICNNSYDMFGIDHNQLCPPYPDCLNSYTINSQDTTSCP